MNKKPLQTSGEYHYTMKLSYEYGWALRGLANSRDIPVNQFLANLIDEEMARNPKEAAKIRKALREAKKAESEDE
jgi:hypothetical protein